MNDQQSSGLLATVRNAVQRNQDLLRNAGSLAATTGLTSLFGFVFWIIAAKEFNRTEVGYGSAAINAMSLLGTVGMFGLGTMLIGELPRRRERGGLMTASLIASSLGSLVLGLAFPLVVGAFGLHFPEISGTLPRLLLFAFGVMLTGGTLVFDEGTIGLMRGGVQLSRNLAMSALKLVALPVTAVVLHDGFGVGIMLAFVIGTVVSIVPAIIMLARSGSRILHRPDWGLLRRLAKVAMAHNWLNLAIATPPKLIPVLVTIAVSPSANAVFYVAWMIASFLFMVPVHLSTVLFAIASASPEVIAEKLRFVLRLSLLIGLPVMVVLAIGAHFALNLFGHDYAVLGTVPLWLLILEYIPQMPKAQYIAVCRATGKVGKAAIVLSATATAEFASIIIGGKMGGLDGLSFAYLIVSIVEGAITAPTVLRAAYARTAAATGASPAISATARPTVTGPLARLTGPLTRLTGPLPRLTGPLQELPGYHHRQETGLAALFALASAAVSEEHTLDVATEVWRTGAFPAIPADAARLRQTANTVTTLDLLGGQRDLLGSQPAGAPPRRPSYRHRQQAGVDALIAIATPVAPQDDPTGRPSEAHRSR
jgi:O-antigen/teichoic acid export membrane protein